LLFPAAGVVFQADSLSTLYASFSFMLSLWRWHRTPIALKSYNGCKSKDAELENSKPACERIPVQQYGNSVSN